MSTSAARSINRPNFGSSDRIMSVRMEMTSFTKSGFSVSHREIVRTEIPHSSAALACV